MKRILNFILSLFVFSRLFALTAFTGYAGAKLTQGPDENASTYEGQLKLQAFFAGQFNFNQNIWSHMEFSIDTDNLLSDDIFKKTPASFRIDELSLTGKMTFPNTVNYLSAFIGTYDPIGSDILLKRYFGIEGIASKITDSWLGSGNSILYPQWGMGLSDIIKSYRLPALFGFYAYINNEDDDYKVFNFDLRGALSFHYFTLDAAAGIGAPLSNKSQGKDVIVAIDKLYWHMGTTILVGNNYTAASLFSQFGINNASITPNESKTAITPETCYFLVEPRFYNGSSHCHLSFYILPDDTVDELMLIEDTMGINLNIFRNIDTKNRIITIGSHLGAGFKEKYVNDLKNISDFSLSDLDVNLIPYISTNIFAGTLNASLKIRFREFASEAPAKAFVIDLGYKTKL